MDMLQQAQTVAEEIVRLRRDIHAHPELSFREVRTAQLVAETLQEIGFDQVRTGIGRTGVIVDIGPGTGPTIAIRADMDALPVTERTGLPFASRHAGVMHACGHDAHTAMLLGVAHLLRQSMAEETWHGNVRLLFQPAEEAADEQGVSGAMAMMADGALEGVNAVIALHIDSTLPSGVCYFQDGYSHAAVDSFEAWLYGTGGHGAEPHQTVDPLFILAPVLTALYAIPSRRLPPLQANVLSLGQIHAGTTSNVIPREVYLHGTLRSYDPKVRQQLRVEVANALQISEALGGYYELKIKEGYPAMYNSPLVNDWLMTTAAGLLGERRVAPHLFGMGAEDFAYMTQAAKGSMFLLGAALVDGRTRPHHADVFDIDERALPVGAAVLAETARRFVTGQLKRK